MSNPPHRSHKRQKSSVSNQSFYFNQPTNQSESAQYTSSTSYRQDPPQQQQQQQHDQPLEESSESQQTSLLPSVDQLPQSHTVNEDFYSNFSTRIHPRSNPTPQHEIKLHSSSLKRGANVAFESSQNLSNTTPTPTNSTYYPQGSNYQDPNQFLQHQQYQPFPQIAQPSYYQHPPPSFAPPTSSFSGSVSSNINTPPIIGPSNFNSSIPQSHSNFQASDNSTSYPFQTNYNSAYFPNVGNKVQSVYSTPAYLRSNTPQQYSNLASSTIASNPTASASASASASRQPINHSKNNLSISSHLTLFTLGSQSDNHSSDLPKNRDLSQQPAQSASNLIPSDQPTQAIHPIQPVQPISQPLQQQSNSVLESLLSELIHVDGSNINIYLLSAIYKINMPFPLDDFYNLLYNDDANKSFVSNFNFSQKMDKTPITSQISSTYVHIVTEILNTFKDPNLLLEYFPDHEDKENKFGTINYHELLRTFLAIKILHDMMIQLPLTSDEDPQDYTIPRLSLYKTYFIICQKLIASYPSSSNTTNEQQKLILGQSKLGKLIKLVYPNLLIKRLGSRGESKYNYLGVMWNEHIIDDTFKKLCEDYDIPELMDLFSSENSTNPFMIQQRNLSIESSSSNITTNTPKKSHHRRNSSKSKIKLSNILEPSTTESGQIGSSSSNKQKTKSISTPRLSFIKSNSLYPNTTNFTILRNFQQEENWFSLLLKKLYESKPQLDKELIKSFLLTNSNLLVKTDLLNNLINSFIKPLSVNQYDEIKNIDLNLYLILILELVPHLLLIKPSTDLEFLKNLRINLLYLINNFNSEIKTIDSNLFPINNSTIFLIILKKLMNLNDLLITFIKLLNLKSTNILMSKDIENFSKTNSLPITNPSTIKLDSTIPQTDDDSTNQLFFNITPLNDLEFNFQKDILTNDLIYTLVGFNYDPLLNNEIKSSISINFITEEINIIDEFFKNDLLKFLNSNSNHLNSGSEMINQKNKYYNYNLNPTNTSSPTILNNPSLDIHLDHLHSSSSSETLLNPTNVTSTSSSGLFNRSKPINTQPSAPAQPQQQQPPHPQPTTTTSSSVLSPSESSRLISLFQLIDEKLLSNHFKSKYPILIFNNYLSYILNDILKYIFLNQQQSQNIELSRRTVDEEEEAPSTDKEKSSSSANKLSGGDSNNSFGAWWVFNSLVQEYLNLIGEIVGLNESL